MIEEEDWKRKDAWNEARIKRLELKEEKMMIWKERKRIQKLITGLDEHRMETFDGGWEEHDLLDGWMLGMMVSYLGDEDVVMGGEDDAEEMEVEVEDDDMDTGVWLESIQKEGGGPDDMEVYEDWLENELSLMMVDEETVRKVRNKSVLKFATSVASVDKYDETKIYNVEVACVENNVNTICEGWNDVQ